MALHCVPSIQEAEEEGLEFKTSLNYKWIWGQHRLERNPLFFQKKERNKQKSKKGKRKISGMILFLKIAL
jgi:hypothetical protein